MFSRRTVRQFVVTAAAAVVSDLQLASSFIPPILYSGFFSAWTPTAAINPKKSTFSFLNKCYSCYNQRLNEKVCNWSQPVLRCDSKRRNAFLSHFLKKGNLKIDFYHFDPNDWVHKENITRGIILGVIQYGRMFYFGYYVIFNTQFDLFNSI